MIELGKYNKLKVSKFTDFGLYLSEIEPTNDDKILLPKSEIPENTKINDIIEVFIYKDSEDRDIATTKKVPLVIDGLALLKVKDVNQIGAFLDWGLMKDLLLPFKEQTTKLSIDDQVLVSLYIDKSKRLCATMKIYPLLSNTSPYQKDDLVHGIVYEIIENFGIFVAIDYKYSALIPNQEIYSKVKVGDMIEARVKDIREDGKLTLSLRQKSYIQMDSDTVMIMNKLESAGGFLPFHDKSTPEDIKNNFNLSKSAFKRAIGRLYKAGVITLETNGIKKVSDK